MKTVSEHQNDIFSTGVTPSIDIGNSVTQDRWPETLAQLIEVFTAALMREYKLNQEQAANQARTITYEMAMYFGGNQVYLPKGDKLQRAIRDNAIWKNFNGRNIHELVTQYRLTHQQIHNIVREQRALHLAKVQPKLPFDDNR